MFDGGVGEGPPGLRLQPARGDGIQHGSVHPEDGRGRTCSAGREDPCKCTIFLLESGIFFLLNGALIQCPEGQYLIILQQESIMLFFFSFGW